jgi:hypothetical protein
VGYDGRVCKGTIVLWENPEALKKSKLYMQQNKRKAVLHFVGACVKSAPNNVLFGLQ